MQKQRMKLTRGLGTLTAADMDYSYKNLSCVPHQFCNRKLGLG